MAELLGDTVADGRAAFHAGAGARQDGNGDEGEQPASNGRLSIDPELLANTSGYTSDIDDASIEVNAQGKRASNTARLDADPSGQAKRARSRKSTSGGLEVVGQSIFALSDAMKEASSEEKFKKAVRMIEEEEGFESDNECALAVKVVTKGEGRINTYLSFGRKGARKAWLKSLMEKELDE
jgi:hypothetical protein